MTNPKGQEEDRQEVQKVSEFRTTFAFLRWNVALGCAAQFWHWTQVLVQQLQLPEAFPELLLNQQGWMVLAASPGWCGAQTYLLTGACSENLVLAELRATMATLRVMMQVCLCTVHARTL